MKGLHETSLDIGLYRALERAICRALKRALWSLKREPLMNFSRFLDFWPYRAHKRAEMCDLH